MNKCKHEFMGHPVGIKDIRYWECVDCHLILTPGELELLNRATSDQSSIAELENDYACYRKDVIRMEGIMRARIVELEAEVARLNKLLEAK